MDKERQIDEIVKIICPVYKDGAKCTFNERQFGERKCARPCTVRTTAEQLIDAGYRPVVHGEWNETKYPFCNVCPRCKMVIDRTCIQLNSGKLNFCPNCGAKMDGGVDDG